MSGQEDSFQYQALPQAVQTELAAKATLLEQFGSMLKRPHADTLNGSQFSNMKELRFAAAGVRLSGAK